MQQKSLFKSGLIFVSVLLEENRGGGVGVCVGGVVCVLNQVLVTHISEVGGGLHV